MSTPFKSLRGLPFRIAVSAISADHEQRLTAWLAAQPRKVNRRRARAHVLTIARNYAQREQVVFREGLEATLYQLECEAARLAVPA
jgi:hypothetical protein